MAYNTASDAPQPDNFINPVQMATKGASELAERAEALANRIVGAVPPANTSSGAKLSQVPSSVLDQVSDAGRLINGDLARAFDAVNRIERALP